MTGERKGPSEQELGLEKTSTEPAGGADKKPRSKKRIVEGNKTKIFVSENEGGGEFIGSSEMQERIDGILSEAALNLEPEAVVEIKAQFERAMVIGLRKIAQKKNEESDYDVSSAKGAFYSAKMEQLKHVIDFEINNYEQVTEIFKRAARFLKPEVVQNLKDQFKRSVERIRNDSFGHDTSEQIKILSADVDEAIQNSRRPEKEDQLIPELKTRRKMNEKFGITVQGLLEDEKVLLVEMDLDGFKQINDSLGHVVGDKVLRSFGISLFGAPRPDDTVAHYSGDEFGMLLKLKQEDNAKDIVKRIINKAQDEDRKTRPIPDTQEVSIGIVEIGFGDKEQFDFDRARDFSDQAAAVSKTLGILLEIRGNNKSSGERIVQYSEIEEIKSQYPEEEWEIADIVRGMKRGLGSLLSIGQMAEMAKMSRNGEMQKVLKERGVE